MPLAVRRGIFNVDRREETGAVTGADRAGADQAEVDRARAVTVDDGMTTAVEGIIENTQKIIARTKMCKF